MGQPRSLLLEPSGVSRIDVVLECVTTRFSWSNTAAVGSLRSSLQGGVAKAVAWRVLSNPSDEKGYLIKRKQVSLLEH
jgi:hypothetical protein